MGTNCAPLVADFFFFFFFFFCYERDFMKSLQRENQADIVEAFNSTSTRRLPRYNERDRVQRTQLKMMTSQESVR